MSRLPIFDIFRGRYGDPNATWVEGVAGLAEARLRMEVIAAEARGAYFVFSALDAIVLASIDTTKRSGKLSRKAGAA